MAELVFTEGFIEDASLIQHDAKRDEVKRATELLADFPQMGSSNIPESILQEYGTGIRKLAVNPFDVIYEISEAGDTVYLLGLVHQRAAK